ncbi:hypothetical protein HKCCSP123_00865 [Rhodobacterales bacterium HKCCSP123]|nr:hypothetical protein [Rhodobacterales bacterium HKCCSP123]
MTITAACEAAGMSRQGWHKSMKRDAVKAELEAEKARFLAEVEGRRSVFVAQALEVALDLMRNAKSESVRARMVEFLASYGEPQKPASARQSPPQFAPGYNYGRPPAQRAKPDDDDVIHFA